MGAFRSVVATLVSTQTNPSGAIAYQPPGHPSFETDSEPAWTTPPARRYPIIGLWRLAPLWIFTSQASATTCEGNRGSSSSVTESASRPASTTASAAMGEAGAGVGGGTRFEHAGSAAGPSAAASRKGRIGGGGL